MKRQGKKFWLLGLTACGMLAFLLLPPGRSYAYTAAPFSAPQTGTLQRPTGSIDYARRQFRPQGSGSYLIWSEADQSGQPQLDTLWDTHDIAGMSLTSTTSVGVTTLPGNQMEPAISGSLVVWETDAHSCPDPCDRDIEGIDLATGITFTVATGSSDQAHPALAGSSAVWIDLANNSEQLLLRDIAASSLSSAQVITTVSTLAGYTLSDPAISSEYVVWSDEGPSSNGTTFTLRAYNRSTGVIQTVTQSGAPSLVYALADHRLVWEDTTQLYITDLSTGGQGVLFDRAAVAPAISGDTVVWSSWDDPYNDAYGLDIWGVKLASSSSILTTSVPGLLVSEEGNQLDPALVGDTLAWQNEDGPSDGRVELASLSAAFAAPPTPPPARTVTPGPTSTAQLEVPPPLPTSVGNVIQPAAVNTPAYPAWKGLHAANSQGWCVPGPPPNCTSTNTRVLDGLVESPLSLDQPRFGSVLVEQLDLDNWTTGYPDPPSSDWGARVAVAMRQLASSGVQITVRTKSYHPNSQGSVSPTTVLGAAGQQGSLLGNQDGVIWRNWMRRVQIDNEPNALESNGGWPDSCASCYWANSVHYPWSNVRDPNRYNAINDWYTQVRVAIENWYSHSGSGNGNCDYVLNNNITNDPNYGDCYNLKNRITWWSPPMDPGQFYDMIGGQPGYVYIMPMLDAFLCNPHFASPANTQRCFSYHDYPFPSNTRGGPGIVNISWNTQFSFLLRAYIASAGCPCPPNLPNYRSAITEFGWDPGQMGNCGVTQHGVWRHDNPCHPADGQDHYFQSSNRSNTSDIDTYLTTQRDYAAVIAVWLERGWSNAADGIDQNGNYQDWFSAYRTLNP